MNTNRPLLRPVDRRWFLKSTAGTVGATALSGSALRALADERLEVMHHVLQRQAWAEKAGLDCWSCNEQPPQNPH